MFDELDTVVLTRDLEKYGLKRGDMGAVVYVYDDGRAVEVEFLTAKGRTVAVLTLTSSDIRLLETNDILHVRGFSAA